MFTSVDVEVAQMLLQVFTTFAVVSVGANAVITVGSVARKGVNELSV